MEPSKPDVQRNPSPNSSCLKTTPASLGSLYAGKHRWKCSKCDRINECDQPVCSCDNAEYSLPGEQQKKNEIPEKPEESRENELPASKAPWSFLVTRSTDATNWKCNVCLIANPIGTAKCAACETPREGEPAAATRGSAMVFKPSAVSDADLSILFGPRPVSSPMSSPEGTPLVLGLPDPFGRGSASQTGPSGSRRDRSSAIPIESPVPGSQVAASGSQVAAAEASLFDASKQDLFESSSTVATDLARDSMDAAARFPAAEPAGVFNSREVFLRQNRPNFKELSPLDDVSKRQAATIELSAVVAASPLVGPAASEGSRGMTADVPADLPAAFPAAADSKGDVAAVPPRPSRFTFGMAERIAEDLKAAEATNFTTPTFGNYNIDKASERHKAAKPDKLRHAAGILYTWGSGECDQLAVASSHLNSLGAAATPFPIVKLRRQLVVSIACGALHSACLLASGKVVTWGCNDDFCLGRDGPENIPAFVTDLPPADPVVSISCGDCHTAALTESGKCFVWGCYKDNNGYIGFPNLEDLDKKSCFQKVNKPTLMETIKGHCVRLSSGENHTAVLSVTDDSVEPFLWVFGSNEFGQLLREPLVDKINKLQLLYPSSHTAASLGLPGPVVDVSCGRCTTFLQVRSFAASADFPRYFGAGRCCCGELGVGEIEESVSQLKEIESFRGKKITSIQSCQFASIALTSDGSVYTWGKRDYLGQGANKFFENQSTPQQVQSLANQVLKIGTGSDTMFAVKEDGTLLSWGEGQMYQLGDGNEYVDPVSSPVPVTDLDQSFCLDVCGGSQHSVALAFNGSYFDEERALDATSASELTKRFGHPRLEKDFSDLLLEFLETNRAAGMKAPERSKRRRSEDVQLQDMRKFRRVAGPAVKPAQAVEDEPMVGEKQQETSPAKRTGRRKASRSQENSGKEPEVSRRMTRKSSSSQEKPTRKPSGRKASSSTEKASGSQDRPSSREIGTRKSSSKKGTRKVIETNKIGKPERQRDNKRKRSSDAEERTERPPAKRASRKSVKQEELQRGSPRRRPAEKQQEGKTRIKLDDEASGKDTKEAATSLNGREARLQARNRNKTTSEGHNEDERGRKKTTTSSPEKVQSKPVVAKTRSSSRRNR